MGRSLWRRGLALAALLSACSACACSGTEPSSAPASRAGHGRTRDESPASREEPREEAAARPDAAPLPDAVLPAPPRLIAIGDVHGDVDALRRALVLGGAIDGSARWIGGALWVVQLGDYLDRGDEEPEILALLDRLEVEAASAGGRFIVLNGNHEVMNAQSDFRYVTPDGFHDFDRYAEGAPRSARAIPREARGRAVAFAPGGAIARTFAARATVIRVGDTVFVHGGLTPAFAARGLDAINREVRAFFLGEPLPSALGGEDSPIWHRGYALTGDARTCASLDEALGRVGATRLVVGHTVQAEGINSACDGHVWRIDVGLAELYGGPLEVLEITGESVAILGRE